MELSTKALTLLVYVSLAVNALLTVGLVAAFAARGRRRGEGAPRAFDDAVRGALEGHGRAIKGVEGAIRRLAARDRALQERLDGAVQLVGLVRYDAFAEMGGRLSFSCALLDRRGDGVVVTSINGRQDTRVYAKPVRGGTSSHNLSVEEEEAIRQALAGGRDEREAVEAR